jgi:peptidoglycan/LPS O-acetylase OafA/YrhL
MEPSKREAELFASIVARIGDPERRRLRLIAAAAAAAVLALGLVIVVLVLRWPWPAAVSFAVMCVVGVVAGLLLMAPELFRRSR